uniref:Colony stimulating factor 1b (macrophage) n=1 Tax=Gadus morhua TaxID=8049 RepID=A0A8C4ZG33_GADMO
LTLHLCFLLPLLMSLAWGLPGPCRHSVTKHHLLSLSRLMDNQLENGCSIVYAFTERQNLSEVCYVKAAFPHILELLNTHFNYAKNSDNRRYVSTLRRVIFNLYSQGCVPEINEEIEDSPVSFTRVLCSSPKEALQKARGVVELYAVLLRQRSSPLDWSCQEEYAVPYSPEAVSVRVPVLMDETDGQADKDLMYRSEASTTGPSVLSENASVSPALGLADGQRTFSSGETTTHGWAKGTMEAKDFDSQHQYDTVTQAGGSPQT